MFLKRYLAAALLLATAAPAYAQQNSKEIMAQEPAKLVEILRNADSPVFDKAKACQRLAVVGTPDAIPALVALLPDEQLNLYARFGLEGIPDPAVDEAFRAATTKLQGRQLVGVLDSIGQRKDVKATQLLKGFLANSDKVVASAAAGALGRIGTSEAGGILIEALFKDSAVKASVADACLACSEALAKAGDSKQALALAQAVAQAGLPKHLRIAALTDQLRLLKGDEAKQLLLTQLGAQDEALFNLGLAAARRVEGEGVTAALVEQLNKLPPEREALLLLAIGDRREPVPMPVLISASQSGSPEIRAAAIRLLAKAGDASAAEILLDVALSGDETAAAARQRLETLESPSLNAAIAAKLAGADPKAKVVLFELVGIRRITDADAAVRGALDDQDQAVRGAAIGALGQLVELKDLDVLLDRALGAGKPEDVASAKAALTTAAMRMSDPEGCAAQLASKLEGATLENQIFLLEVLGKVSGAKALETVVASVASDYPEIKDASTRVLGEWVNADAAKALLDIAQHDPENKYRVRALRGYIRIARQLLLPTETRLEMFRTAMDVSKRDEEKQLALDILTRIPSPATLELAASYAGQPALKEAAAEAAVKIATQVVTSDPAAVVSSLKKLTDAGVEGTSGDRVKRLLDQAHAGQ